MNERPSPEKFLADLKDESRVASAKLKIFLGMCPGVGKTYAMLQAAKQLLKEGVDVVVGLVETHGRIETQTLLHGLEIIPKKKVQYKGITIEEMDIDAILKRKPQAVLVDELAHTNAPGSRHPKRYQDALELLGQGISVLTTLNIQHIESRVDIIRQITGITVHERVPDTVIDTADEIRLIDLTPEELRIRLEEGKVYLADKAATATINFFKLENLAALREMALRYAAERADQDLREAMTKRKISGPWKSAERLLVGIGASPASENLIRWTRRMADSMSCSWIAVYVEPDMPLSQSAKERVVKHISLAKQLGAEVILTSGFDVSETLIRVAKEQNATQIVIGKPYSYNWQSYFKASSIPNKLMRKSGNIDIYLVQSEEKKGISNSHEGKLSNFVFPANEFLASGLCILILTLISLFIVKFAGYSTIALLYLLLVLGLGLKFGRWPVLSSGTACAFIWNFLFVPPILTFNISKLDDFVMFITFFIAALAMGNLTTRLRLKEATERKRENRIEALYELARQTTLAEDLESGLKAALNLIESTLSARAALYLRLPEHKLSEVPLTCAPLNLDKKEASVANWAFLNKQNAGRFTDTLPDSEAMHIPLKARIAVMGVLSIKFQEKRNLDLAEYELLGAIADLIASILEKDHLIQAVKFAEIYEASKKTREKILEAVSKELNKPIDILSEELK